MRHFLFVLDEAGAKGYSDKMECQPGELGVMAGYLVPYSWLDSVKAELDPMRARLFPNGKTHITDLLAQQQEELRKNIFEFFMRRNICWVYEAIYVQGFFENSSRLNQLSKKALESRRSHIKVSRRANIELLHAELFQGAFGKAVAFCLDHVGSQFTLDVIADRTDVEIIKRFTSAADDLLCIEQGKTDETTGFDTKTKQVVRGAITTKIASGLDALGDFSGVSYTIVCEDSSLTLAADVLVNSVNHHLKSHQARCIGVALNTENAIVSHPLSSLVYGAWNDAEGNYFADAIFMHPRQTGKGDS